MFNFKQNIPLAPLTTFKVGGMAKYFAEVTNAKELEEALIFARDKNIKMFVLGGGSNVVVSDQGFDGLVVMMKNVECEIADETIVCGAGLPLSKLVQMASENGLSGLEWAVGIPGTVGGAVRGNAGAYGSDMASVVENVEAINIDEITNSKLQIPNKFQIKNYQLPNCEFSYRNSIFKQDPDLVIISVRLKLKKGEKVEIEAKMKEVSAARVKKVVKGLSAGSFFMNPAVSDEKIRNEFKLDTGTEISGEILPAGWMIEHAGLRGMKIGGAMVSEQHGNFILNTGNATAEDIVMLASIIKQKVRDKYHVQLREEINYVGF